MSDDAFLDGLMAELAQYRTMLNPDNAITRNKIAATIQEVFKGRGDFAPLSLRDGLARAIQVALQKEHEAVATTAGSIPSAALISAADQAMTLIQDIEEQRRQPYDETYWPYRSGLLAAHLWGLIKLIRNGGRE